MKNFNENWDGRLPRKNTNDINTLSEASQQVIGKYRFTPFTEGSIKGWTISIQNHGKVGHIEEPKMDSTGSPSLQRARAATSPYKIYRSNDPVFPAGKKAFVQGVLRMTAYPGTENRVVSEKEIRFAPRELLKAVTMWLDKNGGMKEGVENTEMVAEASQQVIGKYRFTPFTKDTNKDGVKGWTISIQNKGVVGYIAEPNSLSNITIKIYRTKGLSFKDFFPGELKMSAYPDKENRITNDVIHYAPRQLLKAVAMWMDKYGTKALTEDMETTEMVADEVQSLDEVQFITPKVPLKGGSNSKEKTDYKLYVELKDVVNDVIKKLEEAESMLRSPSKNSNLSILQTVTQTKQKLKIAVK